MPNGETSVVLSNSKISVSAIKESVLPEGKNIEVLTMQSIKGLEAQNVIIHNFLPFLQTIYKNERALFYRKIYVLLTRSRENLYISLPKNLDENLPDEIKKVVEIIKKYANLTKVLPEPDEHKKTKSSLKLASIKPVLRDVKDGAELVVAGSQLFAIIPWLSAYQTLMAAAYTTTSAALFYRVKNGVIVWLLWHFRDDLLVDDDAIFDDKDRSCKQAF